MATIDLDLEIECERLWLEAHSFLTEWEAMPTSLPSLHAATERSPAVSVVIPTRGRPALVERAITSVLHQSFREFEIIVVVDGPDDATTTTLARIADQRLRVIALNESVGGSEARNVGVRSSRAGWIALLDDDDEWLPDKLEKQYEAAALFTGRYLLLASRFIEQTEETARLLPRRLPEPGENVSEYLFVRRGWQSAEGFLQTSTWFASRELMLKAPFTRGLKRCQDLDWLLHAALVPGVEVRVLPEVLAIFHHEEGRSRVSRTPDWRFLYRWALSNKHYLTHRAFAYVIAAFCVPSAMRQREGASSFLFLLRACLLHGAPDVKCVVLFLVFWLIPEEHRRNLRARYDRLREDTMQRLVTALRSPVPFKAAS
jgi:glycosyltransferase involved in cell wall biosynthesis